jgi:hypothetical protein
MGETAFVVKKILHIGGLAAVALLIAPHAWGLQDDVSLPVEEDGVFFSSGPGVTWLGRARGNLGLAVYPTSEVYRWHGRVSGDVALLQMDDDFALVSGLSAETLADHRNEISFRLVRVFYEFDLTAKWRLGPGILSVGYTHRCSHGADSAVQGRILIRSGLDLGYGARWDFGEAGLEVKGGLHATVIGQNSDRKHQSRFLAKLVLQGSYSLGHQWSLRGGVGGGALVVGSADSGDTWNIASPMGDTAIEWAPVAFLGVEAKTAVRWQLHLHYQRVFDSGLAAASNPLDLFSTRMEFRW